MTSKTEKPDGCNRYEYTATAVCIGKSGVLIIGKSGSGKSDLALRLIDRGARLIGDDRVVLEKHGDGLLAFPHNNIRGMLEIRGAGIVKLPFVKKIRIVAVINLDENNPERYPAEFKKIRIADVAVPVCGLNAFEQSAPAKVEMILGRINGTRFFVT